MTLSKDELPRYESPDEALVDLVCGGMVGAVDLAIRTGNRAAAGARTIAEVVFRHFEEVYEPGQQGSDTVQ